MTKKSKNLEGLWLLGPYGYAYVCALYITYLKAQND